MATNIIQTSGGYEDAYTCTGAVTAGALLIHNKRASIALESGTTGQTIAVSVGVAATLPKKAAASSNVTVGGWVSYTATGGVNKIRGTAATGDDVIGYGLEAAATGATSAKVRLVRDPITRAG